MGDERLLAEARRYYTVGLQLAKESSSQPSLRPAFNTACGLLACDLYESFRSDGNIQDIIDGHTKAVCNIIRASESPRSFDELVPFQLQHFRFKALLRSLVCRRPVVDEHIWAVCSRSPLTPIAETLIQLAMHVTVVLSSATPSDSSNPSHQGMADRVLHRLLDLETEFGRWLTRFRDSFHGTSPEQMQMGLPPNLYQLWSDEQFPMQSDNSASGSVLSLSCLSIYYMCMLLIRERLLDFATGLPSALAHRDLFTEATECAECLCKIIRNETTSSRSPVARALLLRAIFPFVLHWFGRIRDGAKLEWCLRNEAQIRESVLFMKWDRVQWFGFNAMSWLEHC